MDSRLKFIEEIASCVLNVIDDFEFGVPSVIIAQACLESGYGTSYKSKYHNYFGLKYRENRITCNNGYFSDGSQEESSDGSKYNIVANWFSFDSMQNGVLGYFQFLNCSIYKNLKGVTNKEEYIRLLKEDGYCTSSTYVSDVLKLINTYDLDKYDSKQETVMQGKTKDSINCRIEPSLVSKKICVIPKGSIIDIIKKIDNRWYKIRYKEYIGYCVHNHISIFKK